MSYNRIRLFLTSPIFTLCLASVILTGALWYLGPLLSIATIRPLDTVADRVMATLALAIGTLLAVLIILLSRRAKDASVTEDIAAETATGPDEAVTAELDEIRTRMTEALGLLRKSKLGGRFGSRHLYQLPWYIIVGPPGAGKTTAIENSGLHFPLAETMGAGAISGVGGTRNCDWWFTDEAVLLDTAGRYTTQDSDKDADAQAWSGFLDMLKKHRRRQPINGALIAISLSDLVSQPEANRRVQAQAIRSRLAELRDRLGVRFPVYVLFTKADLIAGFQEFFDTLDTQARAQVWGFTLPADETAADVRTAFNSEYAGLLERLNDHSLERMQAETDYQRRSLIAGFPAQMASLQSVAHSFLGDVFQNSRYEQTQFLRGVYFTSGTQEGMPIDRLMQGMSQTFGIGRQAIGTGRGQGRSFFLTRLLNDVIFGEAGLVSADDAVERRYKWAARGAIAASVVGFMALFAALFGSYRGNVTLIADAETRISAFQELAADIPASPIADQNIPAVVPGLNILRDLPGNPAATDPKPPLGLTFGLYQGDAIGSETAQTYRAALNTQLLPRLLFRLEQQMQANLNNPDFLFPALKAYLMLGLQVPVDETQIAQWMEADWEVAFPSQDALRSDLAGHLSAMVNQPMEQIALNGPLVEQVQDILAEIPLSERVYRSIVTAPAARALEPFRLTDVAGPAAARVLVRPSGQPLSAGVDGVYTYDAFYTYVLPQVALVSGRIQKEAQILGTSSSEDASPQALALLSRDVIALYENDYVNRYDQLLADIDILPMESLGQATDVINILTGPVSPIRNILDAVAKETRLATRDERQQIVDEASEGLAGVAERELLSSFDATTEALIDAIARAVPAARPGEEADRPGQFVQDRFAELHQLVEGFGGGPSQLDQVILTMTDVYNELNRLSLGQGLGSALTGGGTEAAARLSAEIGRLPSPMERWATQVAAASSGAAIGGARTQLNAQWRSTVLPFCQRAIDGRYPFNRQAAADVALQDFGRFFAPGGMLDEFFDTNLATFVDTTTNPWQAKRVGGVDVGISSAVLAQFQKAAEIRDAFFAGPGLPAVSFELTPFALDPNVERVTLEVDGQSVVYAHGPPRAQSLTWPATGPTRVAFSPTRTGIESTVAKDGPWAWFRLLDSAEIRRTNVTDRNRVVFNIGGRIAIFQLRAGSALNPFTVGAIDSFRCPQSL